jgi:hypothetical protein
MNAHRICPVRSAFRIQSRRIQDVFLTLRTSVTQPQQIEDEKVGCPEMHPMEGGLQRQGPAEGT